MDITLLLGLMIAVGIAVMALLLIRARMQRDESETVPPESPFATSTEGMKVCPKCGMGNLWTDRRCVSCGTALKG
jgi:uncharacterized protein (DUF983 family)